MPMTNANGEAIVNAEMILNVSGKVIIILLNIGSTDIYKITIVTISNTERRNNTGTIDNACVPIHRCT